MLEKCVLLRDSRSRIRTLRHVAAREVHFVEDISLRSHSTATGYDNE